MESPQALLARELPNLIQFGGTTTPSVSSERVCASYMHPWLEFDAQVLAACASLRFTADVSLTDTPEGDSYFVGCELGLTTRFARHVCEPVAKALSLSNLPLKFGDLHALIPNPLVIPDVALAISGPEIPPRAPRTTLIAAGELKTWWTVNLEDVTVSSRLYRRAYLEPYVGQVVSYMREFDLRYGFLSTYKFTIFVKRVDDFCFHLSLPISHDASRPSLRQCFAGFAVIAAQNPTYEEPQEIDSRLLRTLREPGHIAAMRASPYRNRVGDSIMLDGPVSSITPDTIIIGHHRVATGSVNCIRRFSPVQLGQSKAVFEVESGGMRFIAKCWSYDQDESAINELWVYEQLHQLQPNGFGYFTRLLFFGDIICSTKFPQGRILLLEKVPGDQLFGMWNSLSRPEKIHILNECSDAIRILRSICVRLIDAGKHNVLFDRQTKKVTLLDFEMIDELDSPEEWPSLDPERVAIFGGMDLTEHLHGG